MEWRSVMCRNIKKLRNRDHPPSDEEIIEAALQYVRKVSGYRSPSRLNTEVYNQAVEDIATATRRLLEDLVIIPRKKPES
jgi:hypothetical protein